MQRVQIKWQEYKEVWVRLTVEPGCGLLMSIKKKCGIVVIVLLGAVTQKVKK